MSSSVLSRVPIGSCFSERTRQPAPARPDFVGLPDCYGLIVRLNCTASRVQHDLPFELGPAVDGVGVAGVDKAPRFEALGINLPSLGGLPCQPLEMHQCHPLETPMLPPLLVEIVPGSCHFLLISS